MHIPVSGWLCVVPQALQRACQIQTPKSFANLLKRCRNSANNIEKSSNVCGAWVSPKLSPTGGIKLGAGISGSVNLGARVVNFSDLLKAQKPPGAACKQVVQPGIDKSTSKPADDIKVVQLLAVKTFNLSAMDYPEAAGREVLALRELALKPHRHVQSAVAVAPGQVMTRLEVTSLEHYNQVTDRDGKVCGIPPQEFFRLMGQVGEGVAHLHSRNYLHLDLKLGNILISAAGEAVVGDVGGNTVQSVLNENSVMRKTPDGLYADKRADVFGLAAMFYERFVDANLWQGFGNPDQTPMRQLLDPGNLSKEFEEALYKQGVRLTPAVRTSIATLCRAMAFDMAARPPLDVLVAAIKVLEQEQAARAGR